MKTVTILLLLLLSLPISLFTIAGLVEEEPDPEETAIPIESIHEEVTKKFTTALGFGVSRIIVPNRSMNSNHQLSYFLTGDEGYDVNLIGLVNNEKGSVYQSAAELKELTAKAVENKDQKAIALAFRDALKEKPKTTPPTSLDNRAITYFRDNHGDKPRILKSGDKWIAHGPIRATEAKCMKCHEVQKGELLGLFRYEFAAEKKD